MVDDFLDMYARHLGPGIRSGKEMLFHCWRCSDGKGGKVRKFSVNIYTGQYKCWRCCSSPDGYGQGGLVKFAKMMNDPCLKDLMKRPEFARPQPENPYKQQIATEVYTYLWKHTFLNRNDREEIIQRRGIRRPEDPPFNLRSTGNIANKLRAKFTEEELLASGLFFRLEDTNECIPHRTIYRNRVILPYFDNNNDGQVVYLRSRGSGDPKRKYIGPLHARANLRVWGPVNPHEWHVVITEGEYKAMSAVAHGFHCLALPGMNSSYDTFRNLCTTHGIREVTICFDNQLKSMKEVDDAVNRLAKVLVKAETPIEVFNAVLPLEQSISNGEKMDIDSYLVAHGSDAFQSILESATRVIVN